VLRTTLLLLLFCSQVFAQGSETPLVPYTHRFLPVIAENGMVVGPEKLATEVGAEILRRGGNAVDAAVATGFALAVTYPRAGNLGGGGFMLIHMAATNKQTLIDYRESAPAAATRDMYLDENGEVDRQREYFSHQSAGVPGTVAGMLYALEKYGSLSRKEVLAPAIRLARQGITVSYNLHTGLKSRAERLRKHAESARVFFHSDGRLYAMGEIFRQPDLANSLRKISRFGADAFYRGDIAEKIVDDMALNQGLITAADLADYRVIERSPLRGTFRDYQVITTPPPSSGGVHILQMLNILEGYDLKAMGHNSAAYLHLLAESMKLAYADRSRYLGDPDFYPVPVNQLISKSYADKLRNTITLKQARPSAEIKPGAHFNEESPDTTHYTVADAAGNLVSNTYTLNFSYGSHITVPGTGILLNNEMADFAAKPGTPNAFRLVQGEANKIEPGKRPLSSMTPTLVFRDGKPWLATGSPGGSLIITAVLQTLLNAMEFEMNIAASASAARIHHQWMPDRLMLENGISPDTAALLEAWNHPVEASRRTLGRTQSIVMENGWLFGATDPRRPQGWVASW